VRNPFSIFVSSGLIDALWFQKGKQYIGNLEHAPEAIMTGLCRLHISATPPPILQGDQNVRHLA